MNHQEIVNRIKKLGHAINNISQTPENSYSEVSSILKNETPSKKRFEISVMSPISEFILHEEDPEITIFDNARAPERGSAVQQNPLQKSSHSHRNKLKFGEEISKMSLKFRESFERTIQCKQDPWLKNSVPFSKQLTREYTSEQLEKFSVHENRFKYDASSDFKKLHNSALGYLSFEKKKPRNFEKLFGNTEVFTTQLE